VLDPSPTPSCSSTSTSSGGSTPAHGENSRDAAEFLEIALRCPNGVRLCGKFLVEKTPFEILTEAASVVQCFSSPISQAYYDVFVNEVPRRDLNLSISLQSQQIRNRTVIYVEEKDYM
jgi:hypothetical protein